MRAQLTIRQLEEHHEPMRTLIFSILACCTACSTVAAPPQPAVQPASQQAPQPRNAAAGGQGGTLERIRALVGTPSCASDAQCHSLPLGARACGGPESYLAWSSAKTSQAEIEALGERYKEERRAANNASGMMSTCQFLMDPGAVCRAGTCQPGGGGLQAR